MVHPALALARALPVPLLLGIEKGGAFAFVFAFVLELLHLRRDSGVRVRVAEEGRQARDLPAALAFGADMQRDMGSDKGCNRSTLRILNPVEEYLSVSRFQQIFAGQRALLYEEQGGLMRPVVERQRVQSNQDWERGSI